MWREYLVGGFPAGLVAADLLVRLWHGSSAAFRVGYGIGYFSCLRMIPVGAGALGNRKPAALGEGRGIRRGPEPGANRVSAATAGGTAELGNRHAKAERGQKHIRGTAPLRLEAMGDSVTDRPTPPQLKDPGSVGHLLDNGWQLGDMRNTPNRVPCALGTRAIAFSFGGNNQRLNLRLLRLNTSRLAKVEGG